MAIKIETDNLKCKIHTILYSGFNESIIIFCYKIVSLHYAIEYISMYLSGISTLPVIISLCQSDSLWVEEIREEMKMPPQ